MFENNWFKRYGNYSFVESRLRDYLIYLIYFRAITSRATVTRSIWHGKNRCAITIFVVLKCSPLIRLSLAYTIFQQGHSISVSANFPFVLYRCEVGEHRRVLYRTSDRLDIYDRSCKYFTISRKIIQISSKHNETFNFLFRIVAKNYQEFSIQNHFKYNVHVYMFQIHLLVIGLFLRTS